MGVPGCPEFACWTASILRVRIVLIESVSMVCISVHGLEAVEKPTHITRELFGVDIGGGTKEHPLKGLWLRSDAERSPKELGPSGLRQQRDIRGFFNSLLGFALISEP